MERLLLTIAFSLFYNFALAQNYAPLPTKNASWKVMSFGDDGTGRATLNSQSQYATGHDTIFNGRNYTSLYNVNYDQPYEGAFREDTSKKVYFLPVDSALEFLIYDFGVDVGDTIKDIFSQVVLYGGTLSTLVVDRIDTFPSLDPNYPELGRRWIHFTDLDQNYLITNTWVEGIGSVAGLKEMSYFPIHESILDLACFKLNNTPVIFKGNCSPVGLEENETLETNLRFIKSDGVALNFTLENPPKGDIHVQLVDCIGKVLYSKQSYSSNTDFSIPINDMNKGLYIVSLFFSDASVLSEKVIIQ